MLERKNNLSGKPKILLVLATIFLLGIVTSTVAASQSEIVVESNPAIAGHEHYSYDVEASSSSDTPKWYGMHYDKYGRPTGHLHQLTLDEYYAVLDWLLAAGADPTPQNMDAVYDCMFRGDCDHWPEL